MPPQVVRVDNVEGQSPVKNTGLLFQHLIHLFLVFLLGVAIGQVPVALRLSRVQLVAKPRERRKDGVPLVLDTTPPAKETLLVGEECYNITVRRYIFTCYALLTRLAS